MTRISRKKRIKRYPRIARPQYRCECENVPRPCPFVGCKYNLFLDVRRNKIIENFESIEEMGMLSCVLDGIDEKGHMKLEEISKIYSLSRERIRQIIEHGLRRMRNYKART